MITKIQNSQNNNSTSFGLNLGKCPQRLWDEAKAKNLVSKKQIHKFERMLTDKSTSHLTMEVLVNKENNHHYLVMQTSKEDAFRKNHVLHTAEPQQTILFPLMFNHEENVAPFIFHVPMNFNAKTAKEMIDPCLKNPEEIKQIQMNEIQKVLIGFTQKKVNRIDKNILQDKKSKANFQKIEKMINYANEKTNNCIKIAEETANLLKQSFLATGANKNNVEKMRALVTNPSLADLKIFTKEIKHDSKQQKPLKKVVVASQSKQKILFTFEEKPMSFMDQIKSMFSPEKYFADAFLRSLTPKKLKAIEQPK